MLSPNGLNEHMSQRVLQWEEEGPQEGEGLRMWACSSSEKADTRVARQLDVSANQ